MAINFSMIVQMYHTQTLISLGKLKNPVSDTIEKNLEQAQMLIDILTVLEEKTRGNLDDEEKKMIEESLKNLRLNFVSESDAESKTNDEQS